MNLALGISLAFFLFFFEVLKVLASEDNSFLPTASSNVDS